MPGMCARASTSRDWRVGQRGPRRGDQVVLQPGRVQRLRAEVVAQADADHLHEAAAQRRPQRRVRLDPVDREDRVGRQRRGAEVHRHAIGRRRDLRDLLGGVQRYAERRLGDPVIREQGELPGHRRATVAAHGGDDERPQPGRPERRDHGGDDALDLRDAAAAAGHRHPRVRAQRGRQRLRGASRGAGHVVERRGARPLLDLDEARHHVGISSLPPSRNSCARIASSFCSHWCLSWAPGAPAATRSSQ
jgi:hypothetical protein